MIRPILLSGVLAHAFLAHAFLALTAGGALAQSDLQARLRPITAPVKDAGVHHLASGTWTRRLATAPVSAGIIYNNTCFTGYYAAFGNDETVIDEGRLPSPTGPSDAQNQPGCATVYTVDGFQVGYCTDALAPITATFGFFGSYPACANTTTIPTLASMNVTLPGCPSGACGSCWLVTIDLDSPPQTTNLVFDIPADGNGVFDGAGPGDNLFGWSVRFQAPGGAMTGPMIAGDFAVCSGFDGTIWDPVFIPEDGTGMSTLDLFRVETPSGMSPSGCHFFGGVPLGSFHLQMYADACGPLPGVPFCFGTSSAVCPCGNVGASGHGCANSVGQSQGAKLDAVGQVNPDTLLLHATEMLPSALCVFLQGDAQIPPTFFGDGSRCAGGNLKRLASKNAVAGAALFPASGDPSVSAQSAALGDPLVPGSVRHYQTYYRDPSPTFCPDPPGNTWNVTHGISVTW